MVPTNTGIFLFSMRRKQNLASALGIQKEIWGNHAFFRDTKASIGGGGGGGRHTLLCILLFSRRTVASLFLKKKIAWLPPIFFLDFNSPC